MRRWQKCFVLMCIAILGIAGCAKSGILFFRTPTKTVVTIAVMQDSYVENYNTNYFTCWLEEKTGYDIEFVYFTRGYEKEYLKEMLTMQQGRVDAVFLPDNNEILTYEEFESFVNKGLICDINELAKEDSNISIILGQMDSKEHLYYMPRLKNGKKDINERILWINKGWLEKLGLRIPETYEDLENVLYAFKTQDPNENGIADEIPLITNWNNASFVSEEFLKSAYMYDEGKGEAYCEYYRANGLLSEACRDFSTKQLQEMINSPEDYIGAFTSKSITDVLYPYCAEVITRYTFVSPLKDERGQAFANTTEAVMQIGGYIPHNAAHKKEAFEIMDLMLSEEASLIAIYGEKGVDYRESVDGELSAYGNRAKITTINYLNFTIQNKNYSGAGPVNLPTEYTNSVKWNGSNSYSEYMDARAVRIYEKFYR